ncbi:hypothetical protein X975_25059, partial [Stegodyphus mimosarum]
ISSFKPADLEAVLHHLKKHFNYIVVARIPKTDV